MKMIAIAGGKGFVGARLVETFSKAGTVISIVRGDHLQPMGNQIEIGFDHPALGATLHQATTFIHAAGKLRGTWAELQEANVVSLQRYLELLPDNLQQAIVFSSANVFYRQANDYGRSKWLAEEAWRNSRFADRLTILRPTWIYGPGDNHNLYPFVRMVQRAPWLLPIPGQARMRPVYVGDIVALTVALARQRSGINETWVVAGAEAVSFQELAIRIAALLGKNVHCLPISNAMLRITSKLAGRLGLHQLAQRLEGFRVEKLWFDATVWQYLSGETTNLDQGLRSAVESYLTT